ncbi:MAG: hypothetical protein IPK99_11270 [Flavobacteriales bacterium]|nr:hypothetical protein [Flavobacteriales bacterium]
MRTAFLATCLVATTLGAQTLTEQYIELMVTDTVPLRIKQLEYELTWSDPGADGVYAEDSDWEKYQREQTERVEKELTKLEKEIQAQGFNVRRASGAEDNFTLSAYDQPQAATLRIIAKDKAELARLVQLMRGRPGLNGNVVGWQFDTPADAAEQLISSLYRMAESRARSIATLAGRKLGKLLSAHEPVEKEMGLAEFFMMLEGKEQYDTPEAASVRARQRSMMFRFALMD